MVVSISQRDWGTSFFIGALILGKFFWVDANLKDFITDILKLFKSKDYKINIFIVLFLFWTVDICIMLLFDIHYLISNAIGIVFGFVAGMLLYVWRNRYK